MSLDNLNVIILCKIECQDIASMAPVVTRV